MCCVAFHLMCCVALHCTSRVAHRASRIALHHMTQAELDERSSRLRVVVRDNTN
jgi:hypothetical protein